MTVRKLFLRQAQYTLQVVYEMAAVAALVESLGAAFREGFAAACVVAYESRAHKIEEVRKQNLSRSKSQTTTQEHPHRIVRAVLFQKLLCVSTQEAAFLEAVRAQFDTQVLVSESWGSWGGAPRPWWWFDELTIVLITAEAY